MLEFQEDNGQEMIVLIFQHFPRRRDNDYLVNLLQIPRSRWREAGHSSESLRECPSSSGAPAGSGSGSELSRGSYSDIAALRRAGRNPAAA